MKHPDKILSMTEFVLWLQDNLHLFWSATEENYDTDRTWHLTIYYAELLQTPLSLEMFVAVKDGEVLEKLVIKDLGDEIEVTHNVGIKTHYDACKKILFEGLDYYPPTDILTNKTLVQKNYKTGSVEIIELTKNGWYLDMDELKTIEDLIQQIDLTGTENFWNLIFKP